MTISDSPPPTFPEGPSSLEDRLLDLVELVESRLDGGTSEVSAFRRAVGGRQRPQDENLLASRFQGSRLVLVRGPGTWLGAIEGEAKRTPGAVVDVRGEDVLLLVPGLPRRASASPQERVTGVVARIHDVAPTSAVGISTTLDQVGEAQRGLDEATRALALCPGGKAVLADDVWFDIALSRMRDSLAVGGPLSLLDDPLRSGADLRQTLLTWLEADGDTRIAAERLYLHPNTLRYRLRRAAETAGLDLDDPLQRLVAHLVLTSRTVAP